MDISYAPLRLRSNYSLLAGTMTLEEIVERACRMGLGAVALTDINNLYGAVRFQELARARGLKAIVGAELRAKSEAATLLARDGEGYANLCRALTRLHLGRDAAAEADAAGEEAPLEGLLEGGAGGLYCMVEEPALAERLLGLFPRERLWLELAGPGRASRVWERNVRAARSMGVGVVATGEAWFGAAEDWALHRALRAVAGRTLVQRAGAVEGVAHPNAYMATPAQMTRRLGRLSWALEESARIAQDCDVTLESGGRVFPACALEPGETARSRLTRMCREGLRTRYGPSPGHRVRRRLEREIEVIDNLGFCSYFIVVGEIVAWARGRGIAVLGRGSGASSLVAYLLGITGVDPLRYGLVFERFMNSRRPDYPDLDVDLCWRRRDEVIDHVYEKYGNDRVAMISTHVTFQKRSAVREMAKVWGLAPDDLLKTLREWERMRERGHGAALEGRGGPLSREPLRTALAMARRVQGFPRHIGIHCGGLVIAPGPLAEMAPLERAPKGVVVTQYEMDAVERVGLVKMDLLGNRGLTMAQECIELAASREGRAEGDGAPGDARAWQGAGRAGGDRSRGDGSAPDGGSGRAAAGAGVRGVPASMEDIPDGDAKAAELLRAGDTLGCFQIESPAMRRLLSMIEPEGSDEVIAAVALVRPGPSGSGMKDVFIRRKRGLDRTRFTHPCLAPVLKDTYGVMLYEEDVLKVAAVAAGLPLEDGDDLRRAMVEAGRGRELSEVRRGFLERAARRGVDAKASRALWEDLSRFSSYAFCKAHAAGYGLLAYRTAYLKAHYPAEYASAVLNNHAGMYPTRVHLEDARRRGIGIIGPCVNSSGAGFTVEGGAIRVGLNRIRGLRAAAVDDIITARKEGGAFRSFSDLLARAALSSPEAEALALAGALDFTGAARPALLLEALAWSKGRGGRHAAGRPLLPDLGLTAPVPGMREFDPGLRAEMEARQLGLTPSRHPVEDRPAPAGSGARGAGQRLTTCAGLKARVGRRAAIVGVVSARRRIRTEGGEAMLFLTIEDATGLVEVVVFPHAYRRVRVDLDGRGPLCVTGKVEDHYGALTLVADAVVAAGRMEDRDSATRGSCAPWGGG